jgi:hypothetical protein
LKGRVIISTEKKNTQQEKHDPIYRCTCCNSEFTAQSGNFYYTKSPLFESNNFYSTVCTTCVHKQFKDTENRTGSIRYALIVVCHLLDIYYNEKLFNKMLSQDSFTIGKYVKTLNGNQWAGKTFTTNLMQNDFARTIELDDNNLPVKEDKFDIKNREYCLNQLRYDPFVDNTPADRKFLFNALAEYLTDDVIEDPHKLQSVIPLVKSILQESKFDKLIDTEQKNKVPNHELVKAYVSAKSTIRASINTTASENGLSAKGSGKSLKGANTLTGIMREMAENNFEDIKVNIFDVKMNGTFKNISDISNKSLIDQLNYQSDDYARMVLSQREMIQHYEEDKLKLEEDLRLAKNEISKLRINLEGKEQ